MKNVLGCFVGALCAVTMAVTAHAQDAPPAASTPPPAVASVAPTSAIIERVLVRVNGEILTQSQLTNRQIDALRASGRNDSSQLEAAIAELTPRLLVQAVDELLLVQYGRELGLRFTDDQFKNVVEDIKKSNQFDDASLQAALAQEGMTMEDLRQNVERQSLIVGVQQREIGPRMTITLEEQRQYYKRNSQEFMTPLTVTIRELFVSVPTRTQGGQDVFSVADDEAAKTKITELRTRAIGGEDFTAIVSANSDAPTKANGGLIGPLPVADLSGPLQELLAKLEPGDISEPVRGPRGYQIFKLETRSTSQLRPFDEVRREIEQAIRTERIDPETQKMLARLRTQAVIEWKDDGLRQLYEKHLGGEATAQ